MKCTRTQRQVGFFLPQPTGHMLTGPQPFSSSSTVLNKQMKVLPKWWANTILNIILLWRFIHFSLIDWCLYITTPSDLPHDCWHLFQLFHLDWRHATTWDRHHPGSVCSDRPIWMLISPHHSSTFLKKVPLCWYIRLMKCGWTCNITSSVH